MRKFIPTEERCVALVHTRDGGFWPTRSQCSKRATHTEGGQRYCAIHLPSRVKQRREEVNARHDAKWKAQSAQWEAERAHDKAVANLVAAYEAGEGRRLHDSDDSLYQLVVKVAATYRKVHAKS